MELVKLDSIQALVIKINPCSRYILELQQIIIFQVCDYWPSSGQETYYNLSTNSTYRIVEGQGIQNINNNTSVKIQGCTDENSCNYDPDATLDDNSCIYIIICNWK